MCGAMKVLLVLLLCLPASAFARIVEGHIDVTPASCPTSSGVAVYDKTDVHTRKQVGYIEDRTHISIDTSVLADDYYIVETTDRNRKRTSGYVYRACIAIDVPQHASRVEMSSPISLKNGYAEFFPLDLWQSFSVNLQGNAGSCKATATDFVACDNDLPSFKAVLAKQGEHEFLLGCAPFKDNCSVLLMGIHRISVHGSTVTVLGSGVEEVNTRTGKHIGWVTPVFTMLTIAK
jgi:hypothetical protein